MVIYIVSDELSLPHLDKSVSHPFLWNFHFRDMLLEMEHENKTELLGEKN